MCPNGSMADVFRSSRVRVDLGSGSVYVQLWCPNGFQEFSQRGGRVAGILCHSLERHSLQALDNLVWCVLAQTQLEGIPRVRHLC